MSQPGKILHLYVEVRSVPEQDGKELGTSEALDPLTLQGPDILPQGQRSPSRPSPSSSPAMSLTTGDGRESPLTSKSSSRHSVSFQLRPSDEPGPPPPLHGQSPPPDRISQLLQTIQQGPIGGRGTLVRTYSSDIEHRRARVHQPLASQGRTTAPSTPTSGRRSHPSPGRGCDQGQRSVATFSYIEKASIQSVSPRGSMCQSHPENTFYTNPAEEQAPSALLRERLSDPLRSDSWHSSGLSSPKHSCPGPGRSPGGSPGGSPSLCRTTLDSVARLATHRALEEFGSPELRRRLVDHHSPDRSSSLQRQHLSPPCRSWPDTPILPHDASTPPPNPHVLEPNPYVLEPEGDINQPASAPNSLPRSPASDHLSAHSGGSSHCMSPSLRVRSLGLQSPRPWLGDEPPRLSTKYRMPLPAGRPTDIQHEIPASMIPSSPPGTSQRASHNADHSPHQAYRTLRTSHNANEATGPATSTLTISRIVNGRTCRSSNTSGNSRNANDSSHLPRKVKCKQSGSTGQPSEEPSRGMSRSTISPASSPELARKLAEEAAVLSSLMEARRSPSPVLSQVESARTESSRPGTFLSRESQPHLTLPGQLSCSPAGLHPAAASHCLAPDPWPWRESPTLHRHQPPQYTGERGSPGMERRQYDTLFNRAARENLAQQWRHNGIDKGGFNKENNRVLTRHDEYQKRDRGVGSLQEHQGDLYGLNEGREQRGETQDHSGALGSSQSSSGVTGSLGESSQPERDCLSPETSSQSSQKSNDTGDTGSGMQSDSGCTVLDPSSRTQKIARAKWEFLFGTSTKDSHGTKDITDAFTAPPNNTSSKSPTPTPPSTLPLKPSTRWRGRSYRQKLSYHEVHQVEVELVSPTTAISSSPKMGIIRRTIKYSETDLDAVPLRCYRETDLDEVMLAEGPSEAGPGEEVDVDPVLRTKRSVLGTSASSCSPMVGPLFSHTDGDLEEEEEEEEEGVVSWASVRMQGDKMRQHATQAEDEVYGLLLKGRLDNVSEGQNPLKSPVLASPLRISADGLDSFSRHFETIMESHRAKGTSYSSLDSVDLLAPGSMPVFSFDLPTLTPEVQSKICESARAIMELSFAPLAETDTLATAASSDTPAAAESSNTPAAAESSGPDASEAGSVSTQEVPAEVDGPSENQPDSNSTPSLREKTGHRVPEPFRLQDVGERLALGSNPEPLTNGNKADLQAAKRLAKRLFNQDGFKKSDVARHLSKNNEFSRMVAEEYLSHFNFSSLTIDQALRAFLREFPLMGESQERERVLSHFSRRYLQCNPNNIPSEDSVHTLICALMLLNSDLHGHNVGKRMSCLQFISNLEGLNDGKDFPKELLKALYNSIKSEKLQWTIDEEELRKSFTEMADVRTDSASHTMRRIGSGGNPLVGVAQQSDALLYKNGFLVRKVHADSDGKKTPRGKRGWKTFYVMLKGLVLYLQKGEYRPDKQLTDEDLKNAVCIHHSLAMRAADYSKRPNVFYLRTAEWRVFLFQAPNVEEMQSWITRINTVAAMFSAPPFPAAIGSQKRFSRPLLPGSNSKLSEEEQVKSHETRFRMVSSELTELTAAPLYKKVKGRELEEQKQRQEYLEFEKTRYGTYAMLLRAKIRSGEEDLAAFEAGLFDDGGLQRAHSSPTLPQESNTSQPSNRTHSAANSNNTASTNTASRGSFSKASKHPDPQRHSSYKQAVKQ